MDCINCRELLILSASYKILPNILPSSLTSSVSQTTGDQHCILTMNKIFCICQILGIEWKYNRTVYQLFGGVKKACDSEEKYCSQETT
jgi:hypothetical protein